MDPFSALSLAANIVQFLDFGQKLISKGKEVYKSTNGTLATHLEIELIYDDLWAIAGSLAVHAPPSPADSTDTLHSPAPNINDDQIYRLATSCQAVAQDLLSIVRDLRLDPDARHRKWQSFRQAVKSIGKQSRIDELSDRLSTFRGELMIRLVAILSDRQSVVLQELQKLSHENIRMDLNQSRRLDDLTRTIEEVRLSVREQLSEAATKVDLEDLVSRMRDLATDCTQLASEQRFLASLCYRYMHTRIANVATAYNETFDWIFQPECDVGFAQWLEKDDGIYWISGKPGSGKSTLMKYLCEHERTQDLLEKWASDAELLTANFFFWSIGIPMQKSLQGLLRSLIFAILKQCPGLIYKIHSSIWPYDQNDALSQEFWTLEQLQTTMHEIISQEATSKFCFFIDGLDEYAGHHSDLIRALSSLARSSFIKICTSSRPWNIFEDVYGRSASGKIYLEELTRGDIELYVSSKLYEHTHLALLSLEGAGLEELVNDIVIRAQGVFLWVHLVILSLCEGLTNGDDVSLLQDRLRRIPSDLEKFFRLILDSVESVYKDRMAQTFQVVLQSSEPLTLLTLSFLDQRDLDMRIHDQVKAMDSHEVFERHAKTRRSINGRYKGLLEITPVPSAIDFFGYRVDFFHRTVHDFIRLNDIQQLLQGYLPPDFNAHATICKILLVTMKRMVLHQYDVPREGSFGGMFVNFMYHARMLELDTNTSPDELLDEMEYAIADLYQVYRVRACNNFMDVAIQSGLQFYVCQKLIDEPQNVRKHLTPFLRKLLSSLGISHSNQYQSATVPDMIGFLMEQGVDPNHPPRASVFGEYLLQVMNHSKSSPAQLTRSSATIGQQHHVLTILLQHDANPNALYTPQSTIWEVFLHNVYNNGKRQSKIHRKILLNMMKCLINHGADLNARLRIGTSSRLISVAQIIQSAFPESGQQMLLEMIEVEPEEANLSRVFTMLYFHVQRFTQLIRKLLNALWNWWYPAPRIILDEEVAGTLDEEVVGIQGIFDSNRRFQTRRWIL